MDPKNLQGLDPKLREAYERVMGNGQSNQTSTSPTQDTKPLTPHQETPSTVSTSPEMVQVGTPTETPANPSPLNHTPSVAETAPQAPEQPVSNPSPAPAVASSNIPYPSQVLKTEEKKSKISLPIIMVLLVVFLLSYTFLWIRVFNLKIPFLP